MSRADRRLPPSAPTRDSSVTPVPQATKQDARGQGKPLDDAVRGTMESRFGADFGSVRVHADEAAADSAQAIGAKAFTQGSDIVFGAGRYQPGSGAGQQLLAHELAHVVQQSRGGSSTGAEARADSAADAVSQGRSVGPQAVGGAPVSVQAQLV